MVDKLVVVVLEDFHRHVACVVFLFHRDGSVNGVKVEVGKAEHLSVLVQLLGGEGGVVRADVFQQIDEIIVVLFPGPRVLLECLAKGFHLFIEVGVGGLHWWRERMLFYNEKIHFQK